MHLPRFHLCEWHFLGRTVQKAATASSLQPIQGGILPADPQAYAESWQHRLGIGNRPESRRHTETDMLYPENDREGDVETTSPQDWHQEKASDSDVLFEHLNYGHTGEKSLGIPVLKIPNAATMINAPSKPAEKNSILP